MNCHKCNDQEKNNLIEFTPQIIERLFVCVF